MLQLQSCSSYLTGAHGHHVQHNCMAEWKRGNDEQTRLVDRGCRDCFCFSRSIGLVTPKFFVSEMKFTGSKYPRKISFNFGNKDTGWRECHCNNVGVWLSNFSSCILCRLPRPVLSDTVELSFASERQ